MILPFSTNNPLGQRPFQYMAERNGMRGLGDYGAPFPPGGAINGAPVIAEAYNKADGHWYYLTLPLGEAAAQILADSTIPKTVWDQDWYQQAIAGRPDKPADPSNFAPYPKWEPPAAAASIVALPITETLTPALTPGEIASGAVAAPAAAAPSWFSGSTTIANQQIPNVALIGIAAVVAYMFMGSGKKGHR